MIDSRLSNGVPPMPKIIGNITPEDDYTHPLGPESNFNESVYFDFLDGEQSRGGFIRIGNRANEGYPKVFRKSACCSAVPIITSSWSASSSVSPTGFKAEPSGFWTATTLSPVRAPSAVSASV